MRKDNTLTCQPFRSVLLKKHSTHKLRQTGPKISDPNFISVYLTRERRKLHNEEPNDLYFSPNIVRVIKSRITGWAGHVACMGQRRGVYWVLAGNPEGERPLGKLRHRWVDNIKMDLQEVGCGRMDWIELAQDRDRWWALASAVMNLRVP